MAVAILRFFAGPDVLFGVRCAWFCSLSIIILVPADIWTIGMSMFYSLTPRTRSSVSLLMICCSARTVACYAPPFSYSFLNLIHLEGNAKIICAKLEKVLVRNRRNICTTTQISYKKASQKSGLGFNEGVKLASKS